MVKNSNAKKIITRILVFTYLLILPNLSLFARSGCLEFSIGEVTSTTGRKIEVFGSACRSSGKWYLQ